MKQSQGGSTVLPAPFNQPMAIGKRDATSVRQQLTASVLVENFRPVLHEFERNFSERGDFGARLCVYFRGKPVLDAVGGGYAGNGLQLIRSISKSVLAIMGLILHERQILDLDAPVAKVWPEFAQFGKSGITTRMFLTHTAGLPSIVQPLSAADALDWYPPVRLLQAQEPVWEPGSAHGYHDLTFGWLVGEVLRRVTGRKIGQVVQELLSAPLGLDLWLGVPIEHVPRLQPLQRERSAGPRMLLPEGFSNTLATGASSNPDLIVLEHTLEYLTAEVPAANAVSNARSLCRLFASLIGTVDGVRLLNDQSIRQAASVRAEGPDLVVGWPRRYGTGFMLPDPTRPMGGIDCGSFGHYGRGGCLAFANPCREVSFAYLTRSDRSYLGADPRSKSLAETALACASAAQTGPIDT